MESWERARYYGRSECHLPALWPVYRGFYEGDDGIYPDRVEMEYPTLLDDDPAKMYAYSIESMIAEKFEAIVSLGEANGRMKDFYDIWSKRKGQDMVAEYNIQGIINDLEQMEEIAALPWR